MEIEIPFSHEPIRISPFPPRPRMTVMQLLVPLEDESGTRSQRYPQEGGNGLISSSSVAAFEHGEEVDKGANGESSSGSIASSTNGNVLSDELRDQFETMKAVWRQAHRASSLDGDEQEGSQHASHQRGDHQPLLQQPHVPDQDLKRKARDVAVDTALAVHDEIARWQNGIADLEALLAAEDVSDLDEEEGNEAAVEALGVQEVYVVRNRRPIPHGLRFPRLPAVVPTDDEGGAWSDVAPPTSASSSTTG